MTSKFSGYLISLLLLFCGVSPALADEGAIQLISPADYPKKLEKGASVLLITGSSCSVCRKAKPVFDAAARRWKGKAAFLELSLDREQTRPDIQQIAQDLDIRELPGIVLFRDGVPVRQLSDLEMKDLDSAIRSLSVDESDCDGVVRLSWLSIANREKAKIRKEMRDCPECKSMQKDRSSAADLAGKVASIAPSDFGPCQNWAPAYKRFSIPGVSEDFDPEKEKLNLSDLRGRRIANLGEGRSENKNITGFLLERGISSYAVDFADSFRDVSDEREPLRSHLIYGDATRLSSLPLAKEGLDYIVSTMLLCELEYSDVEKTLIEGLKSLNVGGQMRHVFFTHEKINPHSPLYRDLLMRVKKWADSNGFKIRIATVDATYQKTEYQKVPFHLLSIQRL